MESINEIYQKAMIFIRQSTCLHRSYCAIIINPDGSSSFGYSHAPISYINCKAENKCKRDEFKSKFSQVAEFFEECQVIHAEMDVIVNLKSNEVTDASRIYLLGIDNSKNTVHKSAFPCEICKKLLIEIGFNRIFIFQTEYELKEINLY